MRCPKVSRNKKLLQLRAKLTPSGKVRLVSSPPLGYYDKPSPVSSVADFVAPMVKHDTIFLSEASPLLDNRSQIQQAPKSERSGWGKLAKARALSWKQAKNIRETLAAFDRAKGDEKLSSIWMVTFTLPSVSPGAFKALAAHASYAVNRLNTWFGRKIGKHARCGVWEWQKRGALHYHCVLGILPGSALPQSFHQLVKYKWIEILSDIGRETGADMFLSSRGFSHKYASKNIQVRTEEINKSVAAYLSKYLSKGEGIKKKDGSIGSAAWAAKAKETFYAPPRWSNRNRIATDLRNHYDRGFVIGCFSPEYLADVLGACHDFLEAVRHPETDTLFVEKFGYASQCMYALASDYFDCMDALNCFAESMKSLWCNKDLYYVGFRRAGLVYSYYENGQSPPMPSVV